MSIFRDEYLSRPNNIHIFFCIFEEALLYTKRKANKKHELFFVLKNMKPLKCSKYCFLEDFGDKYLQTTGMVYGFSTFFLQLSIQGTHSNRKFGVHDLSLSVIKRQS